MLAVGQLARVLHEEAGLAHELARLLGQHPQYKFYANHLLADSPRNMADRHYVIPSDEEFFKALDWLREQLLATEAAQRLPA